MWDRFVAWHNEYQKEISWFFIGMFTIDFITNFAVGNFGSALISLALIIFNYMMWKNAR